MSSYKKEQIYSNHRKILISSNNNIKPVNIGKDINSIGKNLWIPDGDITDFPDTTRQKEDVSKEGIEALAWYKSFHWKTNKDWGIYITDMGIYHVAEEIFRPAGLKSKSGKPLNTLDILQLSFRLLFLHEFFHFVTDVAASILELSNIQFARDSHMPPKKFYSDYFNKVYLTASKPNEPLEEALANAFVFDKFRDKQIRRFIKPFMENQPKGYSHFANYSGANKFNNGKQLLATIISQSISHYGGKGYCPLEILLDTACQHISFGDVPIYLAQSFIKPELALRFVRSIPKSNLIQTKRFKKDLDKMPKNINKKYLKTINLLEQDVRHPGLNFEKLVGMDAIFTARIDQVYRISLKPSGENWDLLRIGTHTDIYQSTI